MVVLLELAALHTVSRHKGDWQILHDLEGTYIRTEHLLASSIIYIHSKVLHSSFALPILFLNIPVFPNAFKSVIEW